MDATSDANRAIGSSLLETLVGLLEARPSLAIRLGRAIGCVASTTPPLALPKYMGVKEYAAHAKVSSKTIREYVARGMVEGEHFHRDGQTGRRVLIHVEAADSWRSTRRFAKNGKRSLHDLATNEVLRRRAVLALKKAGGR